METAFAVGARAVLVLSGYGRGEWEFNRQRWLRPPDHVVENLWFAVDLILSESGVNRRPG
jgi:D-glycero-D-manno-heptose 1,7-bisphosphate phosphatase